MGGKTNTSDINKKVKMMALPTSDKTLPKEGEIYDSCSTGP